MEKSKLYLEKSNFVQVVKLALFADKRSCVENIRYWIDEENYREVVTIDFIGGGKKYINVTSNSNGAIFKEIGAAVYGPGAVGEFWR